jgi:hypothetical protein
MQKEIFIKTMVFTVPRHIKDEEWASYSEEQKDQFGQWMPVRFSASSVQSYRVVELGGNYVVRVELKTNDSFTTKLNLKEFDEKMKEAGYELI